MPDGLSTSRITPSATPQKRGRGRPRKTQWSVRDLEIFSRAKAGETLTSLAREFGLTPQRIGHIVKRLGLEPRSIPWPEELIRQAQALHAEELTYRQIAVRLNVTHLAVVARLRRLRARPARKKAV